jgi:uncharacterized caspase-like protein
MRQLFVFFIACLIAIGAGLPGARADEKRVALVIGNGAYANEPHLPNPAHDAEDVTGALKRTGFEVIQGVDLTQAAMEDATIRFARASRNADVAVFYYSGHAMQFNGVNYLMPVDAKLEDEADLKRMTRVDEILDDLQQARNLRILVLDSCRDNPLAESLKRSIGVTRGASVQRGLSKMEAPLGTIISFSTQAGSTARDGDGRNSPFTTAFLKHIEEPQEIGDVFREVSSDVYQASDKTQLPELSLSIIGKFYLNGPVTVTINPQAPQQPAADPCASAEAHWKAADSIGTIAAYEDHLARFSRCAFADLARAKIDALKQKVAVAPATTPPPAPTAISPPTTATTPPTKAFDGNWDVVVVCSSDRAALGYNFSLSGTVKDGVLHAERLTPGTPGWMVIDGSIAADGSSTLSAHGLTNQPVYTENRERPGSNYAYTVNAHFDRTRGSGKRIELRPCDLTFAKR